MTARDLLLAELRSPVKRAIIALYCHGCLSASAAQWLIDALDLREA